MKNPARMAFCRHHHRLSAMLQRGASHSTQRRKLTLSVSGWTMTSTRRPWRSGWVPGNAALSRPESGRHASSPHSTVDAWSGSGSRVTGVVLVVTLEPRHVVLVATERRPIQPLPHAPQRVNAPCIGGVGVVDDTVLEGERAHPGTLERQVLGVDLPALERPEVVRPTFGDRLFREGDVEVEVEVRSG